MKTLESHVNALQRVTSVAEDFNNLVDRMILSVDYQSASFPATPSSPNGLMNAVATVAGVEDACMGSTT